MNRWFLDPLLCGGYPEDIVDNFEWEHGYDMRFGLVHVDFETQRRVPKRSGLWYRDHIAAARDGKP